MPYHYTDKARESDPNALPDVEVFGPETQGECDHCTSGAMFVEDDQHCDSCSGGRIVATDEAGYFYAYGFPGCLCDSAPVGPFNTEAAALADARESAGF